MHFFTNKTYQLLWDNAFPLQEKILVCLFHICKPLQLHHCKQGKYKSPSIVRSKKPNLHYTRGNAPKRGTNSKIHLCGLLLDNTALQNPSVRFTPGQHSSAGSICAVYTWTTQLCRIHLCGLLLDNTALQDPSVRFTPGQHSSTGSIWAVYTWTTQLYRIHLSGLHLDNTALNDIIAAPTLCPNWQARGSNQSRSAPIAMPFKVTQANFRNPQAARSKVKQRRKLKQFIMNVRLWLHRIHMNRNSAAIKQRNTFRFNAYKSLKYLK